MSSARKSARRRQTINLSLNAHMGGGFNLLKRERIRRRTYQTREGALNVAWSCDVPLTEKHINC